MKKPVIFLAFANDAGRYLPHLSNELREIRKALENLENQDYCKIIFEPSVQLDDIFDIFLKNEITIFHYGGHANDFQLLLESHKGNKIAHAKSLIEFFASHKSLKLVFLNGCSTQGQVFKLRSEDIPTIGTRSTIQDEIAKDLAVRFYKSLANFKTIEESWDIARREVKSKVGENPRALYRKGKEKDEFPWELSATEEQKNWKLEYEIIPNKSTQKVDFVFSSKPLYWRFIWRYIPFLDFKKSYWKTITNKTKAFSKDKIQHIFGQYITPSQYKLENDGKNRLLEEFPRDDREKTQRKINKNLFSLFLHGFLKTENPYVLLLADSGVGKTTFLQKLFVEYAKTYPEFSLAFIYCGQNTDRQLAQIPNPENTVLFLDALDEDIQARKDLDNRLKTLAQPLQKFAKVIVSSRIQFFKNQQEEWQYLLGNIQFFTLILDKFTIAEAEEYLTKKYKGNRTKQAKALEVFERNKSFFRRPLLLSYFDYLLDSPEFGFLYQVFEHIVKKWANRESPITEPNEPNKRKYAEILSEWSKNLALKLYEKQRSEIHYSELDEFIENAKKIDFQSRSLLSRNRETDTFAFTHNSFYDYFLAVLLFEQKIKEENPQTGKKIMLFDNPEVTRFYSELITHKIVKNNKVKNIHVKHIDNWQLKGYILANHVIFKDFNNINFLFKCLEKLKELKVKHYFIDEYYLDYRHSLTTKSSIKQNHFVDVCLGEVFHFLVIVLGLKEKDYQATNIRQLQNEVYLSLGSYEYIPREIKVFQNLQFLRLFNPLSLSMITQLQTLKYLYIYGRLEHLSADIEKLTHLQELSIHGRVKKLPIELTKLRNLTKLILRNNKLRELPISFGKLESLVELDLSKNDLTSIPTTIKNLQTLQKLDISVNNLTNLPTAISGLINVQEFYIFKNKIQNLPTAIGFMQNLLKLDISGNELDSLPPEIGKLKNLKEMDLHNNRLKTIPSTIGDLVKMQRLDLSNNQLDTIPNDIIYLQFMQKLFLYENKLQKIPFGLLQLKKLEVLDLHKNEIVNIPTQITGLKKLHTFIIHDNKLEKLPLEIGRLENLKVLYIFNNQLLNLPSEIGNLKNLEELSLRNNKLNSLPVEIKRLTSLKQLDLANNLFSKSEKSKIKKLLPNCDIVF